MKRIEVLKEFETGGVKSYTVRNVTYAISHGEQSRAVDIGGAYVDQKVMFITTGFPFTDGSMVRMDSRVFRIATIGLIGMAGLKRYEAVEVDR